MEKVIQNKVKLCKPCAEALKAEKTVKLIPSASKKDTCVQCNRRRFCQTYQVAG